MSGPKTKPIAKSGTTLSCSTTVAQHEDQVARHGAPSCRRASSKTMSHDMKHSCTLSNLTVGGTLAGTTPVSHTSCGSHQLSVIQVTFVSCYCNVIPVGVRLGSKVSARLSQVHQLLQQAEERASSAGNEPVPKITLDHVNVSFARSGGPGGQNVNKVNTKVDMRFNVKNAYWLSDRIRERIMQLEKNRINKDGEIVISSTKTRTQKGNIEDALAKLQAIIDAASYVPPPPTEEQKKKIAKLAAIGEQNRLKSKKALSDKKAFRRSRNSWD
ncbi:hypothetical protein JRO89_XS13G0048700 [Xanthoceras sorbifolium]|uniref:Prokaryotic-type class I peptide chain release factors domain-containing protein n=1 Tax=Xanthoceras sorbifolium TaxID=99658 RepID=A0ABQ8H6L6_9ROSI|nr:hypothetical protein JRO89_XS13G0048700 [Xanthoceras sorbifolium]